MKVALQKLAFIVVAIAIFIGAALAIRWLANTYWRPVVEHFGAWVETSYGDTGIYIVGTTMIVAMASLFYYGVRLSRRYR